MSLDERQANPGDMRPAATVNLTRVLVVALHQQPPAQDSVILHTLEKMLEIYRRRLAARSGGGKGFATVPGLAGVEFYRPVTGLLWGSYDHATFYLADDLESVVHVASSSGANAQEFIFGSPYEIEAEGGSSGSEVGDLLSPERAAENPLLSIIRVKLPDYLLCLGASALRSAMAREIHDVACAAGTAPIILRCWSWPELAVVLRSRSPSALVETARKIENITIGALRHRDPFFDETLRRAVEGSSLGREIARLWVEGPPAGTQRATSAAEILRDLEDRHAVVAAKCQLGILETAWPVLAADLPEVLRTVGRRAFRRPSRDDQAREPSPPEDRTGELDPEQYAEGLRASFESLGNGNEEARFAARISILVKPGHLDAVGSHLAHLGELVQDVLELRTSVDDEGTTLLLRVDVPDRALAFARLLAISHWPRVWKSLSPHLLDITTLIEERLPREPHEAAPGALAPPSLPLPGGGYTLLHKVPSDEARAFGRFRAKLLGLGRVEGRSLHAWVSAVAHTASRPDMYGAMMELYSAAMGLYNDLVYGRDVTWDAEHPTLPAPSAPETVADGVRDLLRYGRSAYNQRLQFSPVMRGALPTSGQLPYGINQVVGMVDGLAGVIMEVARRGVEEADDPGPGSRTIVLFEPDAAISIRTLLDLNVLRVNLLQTLSPLSLCLLFHELGHAVSDSFWRPKAVAEKWSRWGEARLECIRQMTDMYCGLIQTMEEDRDQQGRGESPRKFRRRVRERVKNFLEDIFPHAVWRRLGCGGDWSLFSTQFLAGQAMGIRTRSDPGDPTLSLVAWAETAVHLMMQRILHENGENVDEQLSILADDQEPFSCLERILPEVLPYAETELADAAAQLGYPDWELEPSLRALSSYWVAMMAQIASDDAAMSPQYRGLLRELFAYLEKIQKRLADVEEAFSATPDYDRIAASIRSGRPVLAGWDVVSDRSHPTDQAFLWARQILTAVTEDFMTHHRGGISAGSFRTRALHPKGVRPPPQIDEGLYTDHTGGLAAVGRECRLGYLAVCNAAMESLGELTSRVRAGRMRKFLLERRDFLRIQGGSRAAVWVRGVELTAPLRNYSPLGFSLVAEGELALLGLGDTFTIQRKDKSWLRAKVVWTGTAESQVLGAVLEPDVSKETSDSPFVSNRLQMDRDWPWRTDR